MPFKNLLILPQTYSSIYRDVKRQRRFVNEVIEPIIAEASANNDGTLDEEDFTKIRNYYGFGVPAIVGEGICTLRGRPMSEEERLASTFQGALTGLYDDFFDKSGLDHDSIRQMMQSPWTYGASSSLEKLFILFLNSLNEHLSDRKLFNHYFNKVFDAQVRSKKQNDPEADEDFVRDITYEKGGYSVLFYRSVFLNRLSPEEENALYHLGGLMQLGNDIFDVYDDSRAGINTLPIVNGRISNVRECFIEKMDLAMSMLKEIPQEKSNILNFSKKFVLGISRCFVCLDQLEKLQQKTGGKFEPLQYSREELICDMEKTRNVLSSLKYFIRSSY